MAHERILIVDDQPVNSKLIKKLLDDEEYRVAVATNAKEALEGVQQFKPDLILMDIHLPVMGGIELTRFLKSHPESRHIKIVAISAYASSEDQPEIIAAGCAGYIATPINTGTFTTVLRKYLDH